MTAIRVILWIVGTLSGGYAMAAVWLLPWADFGVSVAVSASCVIGLGLVRAIETDRQRDLDKARHPSSWRVEFVNGHPVRVTGPGQGGKR